MSRLLSIHLERGCSPGLKSIFEDGAPAYFQLTDEPASADFIVFGRDDWSYLRRSELLRHFPEKCICISEWDKPSFFIPAIYASNEKGWYSSRRTETMNYPMLARHGWNGWVTALADEPASKAYLYSFVGKASSRVRKHLFRHRAIDGRRDDVLIEDSVQLAVDRVRYDDHSQRRYAEILNASKFALCPRGWGTSSVRLFEACEMGVAPVILADRWVPIGGIDWSFALFVDENRVRDLDGIVRSHESEWMQRGRLARQTFSQHFAADAAPRELAAAMTRLTGMVDARSEASFRRHYLLFHLGWLINERLSKWLPAYRT